MTDLRKAAEMALEALNIQTPLNNREFEMRNSAIEALRQALAQPDEVLAEREECAKLADLVAREIDDTNGTASYIAAAIRARGER